MLSKLELKSLKIEGQLQNKSKSSHALLTGEIPEELQLRQTKRPY